MTSEGVSAGLSGAPPMDVDARLSTEEIRIRNLNGVEHTISVDPSEVSKVGDLYKTNFLSLFLNLETDLVPPTSLVRWIQIRDEVEADFSDGANSWRDDGADLDYVGSGEETTADGKQVEAEQNNRSDAGPTAFLEPGAEIEFSGDVACQFVIAHSGFDFDPRRTEEEDLEDWEERALWAVKNGLETVEDAQAFIYNRVYAEVSSVDDRVRLLRICLPIAGLVKDGPAFASSRAVPLGPDSRGQWNLVRAAVAMSAEEWRKHGLQEGGGLCFELATREEFCFKVAKAVYHRRFVPEVAGGHVPAGMSTSREVYLALLQQALELGKAAMDVDWVAKTLAFDAMHSRKDWHRDYTKLLIQCVASEGRLAEVFSVVERRHLSYELQCESLASYYAESNALHFVRHFVGRRKVGKQAVRKVLENTLRTRIVSEMDSGMQRGLEPLRYLSALLQELHIAYDLQPIMQPLQDFIDLKTNGEKLERAGLTARFRETMERESVKHNVTWLKWSDVEDLWRNA
ncbi:unnamed protein product [Amoebophrya sp. A120]|nr:unnamed protein product [Amoebophrya sp. A120]|eukprot:GSA120T00001248001.1